MESTRHRSPIWRLAKPSDISAIDRIAGSIHAGLPERAEVLAEKTELFPEGCMLFDDNGIAVGYGIAHPWRLDNIPDLDSFLGKLPVIPNCLYVHDVAVLPFAQGHNAAGAYLKLITKIARDRKIDHLALVAVYESYPLWVSHGFRATSDRSLDLELGRYGKTARYMTLELKHQGD